VSNFHTAPSSSPPAAGARASTGIPGLDQQLEGGFPAGRSVLVCGGPGTGKTTLATQFLASGIAAGQPGVLVSVDQKPRHLLEDAARFGWDFEDAMRRHALAVLDPAPYFTAARDPAKRLEARQLTAELARRTRDIQARRLVIDSLSSIVPSDVTRDFAREFLRTLIFAIEDNLGCTAVLTWSDPGAGSSARIGQAEAETLATGILDLKVVATSSGHHQRRLFVRKMRGTLTDLTEQTYAIRPGRGVVLEGAS
jgi:KaiC/GvpD/RAD55 family RecA-like ATPase